MHQDTIRARVPLSLERFKIQRISVEDLAAMGLELRTFETRDRGAYWINTLEIPNIFRSLSIGYAAAVVPPCWHCVVGP